MMSVFFVKISKYVIAIFVYLNPLKVNREGNIFILGVIAYYMPL